MTSINLNNISLKFQSDILGSKTNFQTNGEKGCDEKTFKKLNPKANNLFKQLDTNKDGYISQNEWDIQSYMAGEDKILTEKERKDTAMQEAKYFAARNIDKWFKLDRNRDGIITDPEQIAWGEACNDGKYTEGHLSTSELAKKYNIPENQKTNGTTIEMWMKAWTQYITEIMENRFGVKATDANINEIQATMIKQLNTWLLKTKDNKESSGYQQLSGDAYTRLGSTIDGVACCGGDICEFPGFELNNLEKNGFYTSDEMKARLNWAENSNVMDENGEMKPVKMMTPEQVNMYKKIVEEVTGKKWDDDWKVSKEQFYQIMIRLNGTEKDDTLLNGKTRADIPANRQQLLKFLEEKGWLYEQFK